MDCQRAAVWGRLVCSVNTNKLDCLSLLPAVLKVLSFQVGGKKWREDVTRSPVRTLSWVLNSFLELQTYIRSPDAVIHCWVCGFPRLESGVATCLLMAGGGYSGTGVEGRGLSGGRGFQATA